MYNKNHHTNNNNIEFWICKSNNFVINRINNNINKISKKIDDFTKCVHDIKSRNDNYSNIYPFLSQNQNRNKNRNKNRKKFRNYHRNIGSITYYFDDNKSESTCQVCSNKINECECDYCNSCNEYECKPSIFLDINMNKTSVEIIYYNNYNN